MIREVADFLAQAAARRAFERPDSLPVTLGVSLVEDCPGWMVLWSKPLSEPRPWEQEEVRRRLKEAGVEELACATYPAGGQRLHAYAMVLSADAGQYNLL